MGLLGIDTVRHSCHTLASCAIVNEVGRAAGEWVSVEDLRQHQEQERNAKTWDEFFNRKNVALPAPFSDVLRGAEKALQEAGRESR